MECFFHLLSKVYLWACWDFENIFTEIEKMFSSVPNQLKPKPVLLPFISRKEAGPRPWFGPCGESPDLSQLNMGYTHFKSDSDSH